MVAPKDTSFVKNKEVGVRNLYVLKSMRSLESRGYVRSQFNWQWYYYFITPEGVDYLRQWLHIPDTVVPTTYKKPTRVTDIRRGM